MHSWLRRQNFTLVLLVNRRELPPPHSSLRCSTRGNNALCTSTCTLATPIGCVCYTSAMANKITLETLAAQLAKMDVSMERGFGALAEDISKLATKDQIIALHTQVNSIETQLGGMQHVKLQSRVANLEEKVFGQARS